ncbi:hypothetical protein HYE68_006958 [Fusarium pseudograminearum]|nr:hypothetical protein HYE68_006958 [Fusarium pseudograminearum]
MMADQMVNELRLEYLPPGILSEIGRRMPLKDLKDVSMTSKKMRRSFSRWLFHSVAVSGDADEVVYQIKYMLPSVNTEMRQMMMANVKHIRLHVSGPPLEYYYYQTWEGQPVTGLPVLLATVLQQVENVASIDLQPSDSLSEKDHEELDELLSQLPVYSRLYSLEFDTQKIMNRLVNKFARNSIKSLTLNDGRGNNLLEIAKTECPDLRRLILRKKSHSLYDPLPSESLEAVGKDVSKSFPELEWFVIDYKWEPRSEDDAAVELERLSGLLGPFAQAVSGMPKLERLCVGLPELFFRMSNGALASGEDPGEEDYFQRDFESGIAHIAQIAPKLKEICFTTFNMGVIYSPVDGPGPHYVVKSGRLIPYSLICHGVRNTESAKMSLERPLIPGRHGFPQGLIY